MGAPTDPAPHDIVALSNKIGSSAEAEIRERGAEVGHERFDVCVTTPGLVQRVLQKHIRGGKLVNDTEVASRTPKARKPAAHDCFVVLFLRHGVSPFERLIGKGDLVSASHLGSYSRVQTATLRILLLISKSGWAAWSGSQRSSPPKFESKKRSVAATRPH
jgi:hypothetical protein